MARNVGPFYISNHCHPSVNPMRVKTVEMPHRQSLLMQQAALQSLPKPPKPPEKPLLPYMRYSRRVWDSVKASHPDAKLWEIGKLIGQMWRELDEETRQEVLNEYEAEKVQYVEQMKAYRNSPAYQHFLVEKNRVLASLQSAAEENESEQSTRTPNVDGKGPKTWYSMEHIEDNNDEEDPWSIRQMALDRYERNNALIDEIFSEIKVADLFENEENRIDITAVDALQEQQAALEHDIENSSAEFEKKVALLQERTGRFKASLQKLLDFKITAEDEQKMFEKEFLFLQKKWEEHRMKQVKNSQEKPTYATQSPLTTAKLSLIPEQRGSMIERPALLQQGEMQFARHPWRPNFAYQQRSTYQAINPSFHTGYRAHEMRPNDTVLSPAAQNYYHQRPFPSNPGQVDPNWRRQEANPEINPAQACFPAGVHPHMNVRLPQQFYEQTPQSTDSSYLMQQSHQSNDHELK